LTRREPPTTRVAREDVFAVVDAAFAQRRKTVRSALRASYDVERVDRALEATGIDPRVRGEVLVIDDYVRLAEALSA
jgi:16S rRNA (adenine1518-N6/adenine1519-N6)-dimethyltransferase